MNVQQTDSVLSSLATPDSSWKMPSPVISGANAIIVLAPADRKHRKDLSTAKKDKLVFLTLFFALDSLLQEGNCRFQMRAPASTRAAQIGFDGRIQ